MTNLAVIGGGGFLGTNLIERCSSRKILYLDRVPYPKWARRPSVFEERIGDATDLAAVLPICRSADIAWLRVGILGGAPSIDIDHAAQYFDTNVTSVVTLLRACEASQCRRVIFDSSAAVFGVSGDLERQTTATEPAAITFYGASKLVAEKCLRWWAFAQAGRSVQVFRYSRVHAADTKDVIFYMVSACLRGKPIQITVNASRRISFVHINDVMAANLRALDLAPCFTIYNISNNRPISLFDLAMRVEAVLGRRVPFRFQPSRNTKSFEPFVVGMSWEESARELGVTPQWTIEDMIKETAELIVAEGEG